MAQQSAPQTGLAHEKVWQRHEPYLRGSWQVKDSELNQHYAIENQNHDEARQLAVRRCDGSGIF